MGPSVNARHLALRLKRLREASGLTQDEVGDRTGISRKTMYRIEAAQTIPKARDLKLLLDLYGAEEGERCDLEKAAKQAKQRGWWAAEPYSGAASPGLDMYVSLEDSASELQRWLSHGIHGLLQTPDYARAVESALATPSNLLEGRVRLRLERQRRAFAPDREVRIWTIMDEACLRRVVGSNEVMAWQLRHLLELAQRPDGRLCLQVLPFNAGGAFLVTADFTVFELPDGDRVAADDGTFSLSLYDRPDQLARFTMTFGALRSRALTPEASVKMIEAIAKEYEERGV